MLTDKAFHPKTCTGMFIIARNKQNGFFLRFYLFVFRERGREGERERNINVWLPLTRPLLGPQPAFQPCALTGNQAGNPLIYRPALNPLSHTSQGKCSYTGEWKSDLCCIHTMEHQAAMKGASYSYTQQCILGQPGKGTTRGAVVAWGRGGVVDYVKAEGSSWG